jgi:hypothetical protein
MRRWLKVFLGEQHGHPVMELANKCVGLSDNHVQDLSVSASRLGRSRPRAFSHPRPSIARIA